MGFSGEGCVRPLDFSIRRPLSVGICRWLGQASLRVFSFPREDFFNVLPGGHKPVLHQLSLRKVFQRAKLLLCMYVPESVSDHPVEPSLNLPVFCWYFTLPSHVAELPWLLRVFLFNNSFFFFFRIPF